MDVFAYTSKNSVDLPLGIQKTTLEGLFSVSDVLSLHCPLTDATRNIINKENIAKMKTGAILINTGRGPLVDEEAVAEARTRLFEIAAENIRSFIAGNPQNVVNKEVLAKG